MRRIGALAALVLVTGIGLAAFSACREEGPAEKAGKAIDQAVDDADEQAEKLEKKMRDAFE